VFKESQLPYRGVVSTEFVEGVAKKFKEREEYLYVVTTPEQVDDPRLFGEMGYAEETLKSDLLEHKGETVAVGICPNFIVSDNESMVSASKGGIDGPR